MSDYPEYLSQVEEILNNKYPFSFKCAKELLENQLAYDISPPFFARRFVIKNINKWIEWTAKEDIRSDFLKKEIAVKPVFSERQLDRYANATVNIAIKGEICCLFTIADNQRCSPYFKITTKLLQHMKTMISKITLGQLLDEMKLSHYIDDKSGSWTYLTFD